MKSLTCWLAAAVCLAICLGGCRAPAPTFKDVSPFGATRIEPPRTNSFGNPDLYYQPPGSNPAGAALGDHDQGEQLVTLPRGGHRQNDVSLVRYDEEGDSTEREFGEIDDRDGFSDDDLAWGETSAAPRAVRAHGQTPATGSYQPGSVGQVAVDRDEIYGQVPEPATLRILDASPLPGEMDPDWRPSASTPARADLSTATSTNSAHSSRGNDSGLRLNPMRVHDVTSFARDDSALTGGTDGGTDDNFELRDIGQLPPVPEEVRQRLDREQAPVDRTIMRSPAAASSSLDSANDPAGWRVR